MSSGAGSTEESSGATPIAPRPSSPRAELTVAAALETYHQRGLATDTVIRIAESLTIPCSKQAGTDVRWVVLHLINETAGHADAVRELLDGTTGE